LNNFCLIITAAHPWEIWPRKPFCKAIARELKQNNGIVLVLEPTMSSIYTLINYPYRIPKYLIGKYKFRKVNENIYAFSPFSVEHILASVRFKPFMIINKLLLKWQIKQAIKKIEKQEKTSIIKKILMLHRPELHFLTDIFKDVGIVFDNSDDFCVTSDMSNTKVSGNIEREKILCENSDFIIASASTLYSRSKSYNPNSFLIENGYSLIVFSNNNLQKIQFLENIPKPIIGYIGNVRNWIDFELMEYLIKNGSEYSFLFAGNIENNTKNIINELSSNYKNVYILPDLIYEQFPSVLSYFDAGIIPFKENEFTKSVNPNKLYEYLAALLPVFSTNIGDIKNFYNSVSFVNSNKEEFLKSIKKYFSLSDTEKSKLKILIKQISINKTWEFSAFTLHNLINIHILK
jgi:teichuronic acid biosynthesis glycosyltransferase TuaH